MAAGAPVSPKAGFEDPEKAGTCCNAPPPLSSSSEGLRQRNAPESSADRASRLKTTAVTNAAFIVERVDENILPGSFLAISESNSGLRGTKLDDLAKVTLARGVVQALFSPAAGLLGDRLNRVHVIAFASFLWGVMTICMGLSRTLTQMLAFSCVNGLGLALLIPCVQSLLADYYTPANRGRAFGLLYFTSSLGQMAGSQFSISLGRRVVAGEEGWRFVFHLVGAISLAMSAAVLLLAGDPRVRDPAAAREGKGVVASLRWAGGRLKEMRRDFTIVMRIPTFVVIFLQGIVGMMPWVAMSFLPVYLQLLGFSDNVTGMIVSLFTLGTAFGCQLAGFLGDWAVTRFPSSGRVMVAQLSVFNSLPMSAVLLLALPRGGGSGVFGGGADTAKYASAFFFTGLIISWCATNNSAIFAEIVPEQLRTTVFAFNRAIETSISQVASLLVAKIAINVFKFEGDLSKAIAGEPGSPQRVRNSRALGHAMLAMLLVPWTMCFLAFTGLYFTLPRDRESARRIGERLHAEAEAKATANKTAADGKAAVSLVQEKAAVKAAVEGEE